MNPNLHSAGRPDLAARPHQLTVERQLSVNPEELFRAWTEKFDLWFATPGTLVMTGKVNQPYFFETHFEGQRHPHYGRFLELQKDKVIEMTWVTGNPGTKGAETVVRVELEPRDGGTLLRLMHSGFADEQSRDGHKAAWPAALENLENALKKN